MMLRSEDWPTWPPDQPEIEAAALQALRSQRWSLSGPRTNGDSFNKKFEDEWARYCGTRHCVATSSGSSALLIALQALGLGEGDEVIVPAWTWIATASCVLRVGAKLVFADVDPETHCLSAETISCKITSATKAVIVVHLHQTVADMDPICKLASEHSIYVIEDAAQAHGAIYGGQMVGSIGDVGAFSFQQTKVITSGEGGAIVTNNSALADSIFELHADSRLHAESLDKAGLELRPGSSTMGSNHAMSEIQASILLAQLPTLNDRLSRCGENADYLDAQLEKSDVFSTARPPPKTEKRTVFRYTILVSEQLVNTTGLRTLVEKLRQQTGIKWNTGDPPVHLSPLFKPETRKQFKGLVKAKSLDSLTISERLYQHSICFHHSYLLADRNYMDSVLAALNSLSKLTPSLKY